MDIGTYINFPAPPARFAHRKLNFIHLYVKYLRCMYQICSFRYFSGLSTNYMVLQITSNLHHSTRPLHLRVGLLVKAVVSLKDPGHPRRSSPRRF